MTEKIVPFDMVALLDSNEAITELMHALGYIAKAKGLTGFTENKSLRESVKT